LDERADLTIHERSQAKEGSVTASRSQSSHTLIYPLRNLGLSLFALLILAGCLVAGKWQFDRGMDRRAENSMIEANLDLPAVDFQAASSWSEDRRLWRQFTIEGRFLPEHEILMRNRYHNEQYGFGVATLFLLADGRQVWIDRGWVKAGASATTPPEVAPVPTQVISLDVRYRNDALDAKIRGSFFATGSSGERLSKWNQEALVASEPFYFDLIGGGFVPDVATNPPAVSDGPHIAYAIQWWFFGLLALFGSFATNSA
jgi:cytochrome oxidase assembly protein ShyY1